MAFSFFFADPLASPGRKKIYKPNMYFAWQGGGWRMVQPFPKTYIANSNMKAIFYNSDFHPLSFPNNVYFQQLSQYFILNCMCEIGVASEFLLSWGMCRKFEGCLYSYNKMLETVGFMKFNQSFNILEIYIYMFDFG